MLLKRCPTCGATKESTEFHRNKSTADRFATECKACKNSYQRQFGKRPEVMNRIRAQRSTTEARERIRLGDKRRYADGYSEKRKTYAQSEAGRANRARFMQSQKRKDWERRYYISQRFIESLRRRINLDPLRFKARWYVNNAVRDGRVPPIHSQICNECGGCAQQYHHWSYDKERWLDVIALCRPCHDRLTQEAKE